MPCVEGGNMNQRDAYLNRRHLHTQKDDFRTPEYLMKWLKNMENLLDLLLSQGRASEKDIQRQMYFVCNI